MDYIINILLILFIILVNKLYYNNLTLYKKIKKVLYVIVILAILILLKFNLSQVDKFNQNGGGKTKIQKLKKMCGIPENDASTSHCFADGTHQTCCLLGPKAREYSMNSGNEIGNLSVEADKKFKKQNPNIKNKNGDRTPWCTCLGSRVCSDYARKFKDGTKVKFINNRYSNTQVAIKPKSSCEGYYGDLFKTRKHLTPGVNSTQNNNKCGNQENILKNI